MECLGLQVAVPLHGERVNRGQSVLVRSHPVQRLDLIQLGPTTESALIGGTQPNMVGGPPSHSTIKRKVGAENTHAKVHSCLPKQPDKPSTDHPSDEAAGSSTTPTPRRRRLHSSSRPPSPPWRAPPPCPMVGDTNLSLILSVGNRLNLRHCFLA